MKKNQINLLVNREDYQKYENYFERLKLSVTVLTVILFVIFVFFFIFLKGKMDAYDKLNLQKLSYLQMLTVRRPDEAKINYIQTKYKDLQGFLKDDASSTPYYSLLSNAINDSSQSAVLKSFEVNKDRMTSFTISFSDFGKMMNFLKFAESQEFINNFLTISLKNFIVIGSKDNTSSYELSFTGQFIAINQNATK